MNERNPSQDLTVWREVYSTHPGAWSADSIAISDSGQIRLSSGGRVAIHPSIRVLLFALWPFLWGDTDTMNDRPDSHGVDA